MLASAGSSPPRDASPAPLNAYAPLHKKRKHAALLASSPAPSDSASQTNPTENVVLSARNDLFARPRLTISRGPILVPAAEGSEFNTTEQIAVNRIGFRYTPAGLAAVGSTLSFRTIESAPTCFRVSWEDRSPFLKITADGLRLAGDTGFRSARCNAPIREGRWYMEVKIEHGGGEQWGDSSNREGSHVRLGWGRREAPLNGPVGLDGYSYGIRDKTGEKVTLSRPRPYGRSFASGDVVGMYIALPPLRKPDSNDPHDPAHVKRERIAIEFKGQEYFESLEYPQSKEMITLMDYSNKYANSASVPSSSKKSATVKNLPDRGRGSKVPVESCPLRPLSTLPGSLMAFFVNGEFQGIAFQDVYSFLQLPTTKSSRKGKEKKKNREGAREHKENPFDDGSLGYYPFISLFNNARVRVNPGPDFECPPPPDIDALLHGNANGADERTWRPISERYPEYMSEQWALDDWEEEEAKADAARKLADETAEAEKRAQRLKKRQQAEARKRAKKAAEEQQGQGEPLAVAVDDDRFGPGFASNTIPLLDQSCFQKLELGSQVNSPAPTFTSSVDIYGAQSGYNSENADAEIDESHEKEGVSNTFISSKICNVSIPDLVQ